MIVSKFGGTSVADPAALARLAEIVRARLDEAPLVVVSALAGVSDALIAAVDAAQSGDEPGSSAALSAIAERHRGVIEAIPAPATIRKEAEAALARTLAELEDLRRGIVLVGDASPWVRARFVGAGEILSSRIVVAALLGASIEAAWFDAREVVRTAGSDPERDPPLPEAIAGRALGLLHGRLAPGRALVTQGFLGGASVGGSERPTLLGRGGSDYSASLLGRALGARRVEIWTDVDGVLTANPRIVPEARRVKVLSFAEASELAYFGANVLHPSTVLPAVTAGIPVWVGNAHRPEGEGTTILAQGIRPEDGRFAVKAIADKRGITLVHVVSTRMLMAHGFLARIFAAFDAHRTSVDLLATSEVSVSLTIDDDRRVPEIVEALSAFARVEVERGLELVCLVGEGMQGSATAAAEALRALKDVRVRMITQGASANNLSVVVAPGDGARAVQALHDAFFRGPLPAEVFGETSTSVPPHDVPLPAGGRSGLLALAAGRGTPLYVYDLDILDERVRRLEETLPMAPGRLLYACKANAHPAILRRLAVLGVGIEAASPAEAVRAIACGHPPESVLLSATNARAGDLREIALRGCALALGSISDIRKLAGHANGARILLRVNPGVGDGHHRHVVTGGAQSKFGIALTDLDAAVWACHEAGLHVAGLHAHMGSGILSAASLLASAEALLDAAGRLPSVEVLDFGGGIGVAYREGEAEPDLAAFGHALGFRLRAFAAGRATGTEAWFEPGRFLVAAAGVLLATVTTRKESGGHVFIGLDTGMNHLLRPALYGAYHRIVNLSAPEAQPEWVEVVGNVCESTDVFASARALPRAEEGHVVAILDAGAYGMAMASGYCLWPLPEEVVVGGG
jgi:diaminopimelate decarboxylase/aspartate kinase